jgi:hypothetical protein
MTANETNGWIKTYTTADENYDWLGTHTIREVGLTDRGKVVREVLSHPNYVESQRGRYASGLHLCADETEYAKLVDYGFVKLFT